MEEDGQQILVWFLSRSEKYIFLTVKIEKDQTNLYILI